MVGRHDQKQRVCLSCLGRSKCGYRSGRCRIAACGLKEDARILAAEGTQLFRCQKTVVVIGYDNRGLCGEVTQPQQGLLQQAVVSGQGQELLGKMTP